MLHDRRAYSMTFWAMFIGLIMMPLMSLAIDVGRYLYARQEIGKASDAAAVGAVAEIDWIAFRESGEIHPSPEAYAMAQHYANINNDYLEQFNIYPRVTGIRVDDSDDTVYVAVSADLSALFPSFVPQVLVTETGTAQVRSFQR